MIHPDTELRFVNAEIGYGVFATAFIPKGTIVYVKDDLEIEISKSRFSKLDKTHQDIVEKFSYMDPRGVRIVSWDHAKYVNHRCECNSMSTGYGFEIAIRDIAKDEELTDEYGMFNIPYSIDINCGCQSCRKTLMPTDMDMHYQAWDRQVQAAIKQMNEVDQPLWEIMDITSRTEIMQFLSGQAEYRSVKNLKFNGQNNQKKTKLKTRGNKACAA